jgi:putative oxidoreductase
MTAILAFVGRLMIALLFIVSGANKLLLPAETEAMITGIGLPAGLAIPVGIFEVLGGLAIVLGVLTRLAAVLLAIFCLVSAFFFHNNFADPVQAAMLLKNVAIAGGLLCLTAVSHMRWSYDAMRERRDADRLRLEAERRAHDAEVRAARAEGRAEGVHTPGTTHTTVTDVDGDGAPEVRKRRWF